MVKHVLFKEIILVVVYLQLFLFEGDAALYARIAVVLQALGSFPLPVLRLIVGVPHRRSSADELRLLIGDRHVVRFLFRATTLNGEAPAMSKPVNAVGDRCTVDIEVNHLEPFPGSELIERYFKLLNEFFLVTGVLPIFST
jgi:hypothetical protein